ncbi:uncharacterized protein C8Q71DRAFT_414536 [Rhodofomes roseus]|uniref:Secreted protein n=1 Tax=Rhodofomes roseus TaxID=34475 RepID=A0ABQ8KQE6_9APHY|nr:uncharacterized protein C8Q71DRAFT_414536 [Rhodofomes roseus]KAH9840587.1 hypothetical protein C8Q71DRAFT_414536 [Rhodofomes roseus]
MTSVLFAFNLVAVVMYTTGVFRDFSLIFYTLNTILVSNSSLHLRSFARAPSVPSCPSDMSSIRFLSARISRTLGGPLSHDGALEGVDDIGSNESDPDEHRGGTRWVRDASRTEADVYTRGSRCTAVGDLENTPH